MEACPTQSAGETAAVGLVIDHAHATSILSPECMYHVWCRRDKSCYKGATRPQRPSGDN